MDDDSQALDNSDELFELFRFKADKGQQPLRVDKFLMNFIENATRNKIQQAAHAGLIQINGVVVKPNARVKADDEVLVYLNEPPRETELIPEDIPIDIVYEDESVIVVNKAPGMVVHPGHGNYQGTLVNALKFHLDNLPEGDDGHLRPGLVHRIDKDTSGLLVIAKTENAMQHLAVQFAERRVKRLYQALVWGTPKNEEDRIENFIGRDKKNRLLMAIYEDEENGKKAITNYKVLETFNYVSLIQCKLETGRTHQIRAHMKHLGHPIFNDERYGGNKILRGTTFTKYKQFVDNCFKLCPRQALHAKTLGFEHPKTGKALYFEIDLAEDISALIEKWKRYVG